MLLAEWLWLLWCWWCQVAATSVAPRQESSCGILLAKYTKLAAFSSKAVLCADSALGAILSFVLKMKEKLYIVDAQL